MYPKHTAAVSRFDNSVEDELVTLGSTAAALLDVAIACPYRYPNMEGAKLAMAPVSVNSPCAVPPILGPTVVCNVLIVGPNQHSATKYSVASQAIETSKESGEWTAIYHAGAANNDPTTGTHSRRPIKSLSPRLSCGWFTIPTVAVVFVAVVVVVVAVDEEDNWSATAPPTIPEIDAPTALMMAWA